jgi:hypothetical protein
MLGSRPAATERARAGGHAVDVTRVLITDAGRVALERR